MSGISNCFKPDDTDVQAVGEEIGRLDLHELDLVLLTVDAPLPAGR